MSVINTNTKSIVAQNAMTVSGRAMSKAMEQLSTGKRINGAADDAAGLAISSKMTSQIKGLNQAVRNANDGISLIQTAEGALVEVSNMLQRMRELSLQAANDTNTLTDRTALNSEFGQLRTEINRIASNTQWNGMNILDKTGGASGEFKFQVGANATQNIALTLGNYKTTGTVASTAAVATTTAPSGPAATPTTAGTAQVSTFTVSGARPAIGDVYSLTVGDKSFAHTVTALGADAAADHQAIALALSTGLGAVTGVTTTSTTGGVITFTAASNVYGANSFNIQAGTGGLLSGVNLSSITTQANANSAIASVDSALSSVNTGRAEMGATINRLNYAADNLMNVSQNTSESRSRILDTDYAQATTELARTQIISQAATAMLAQANQAPQSVLSLLR